MAGMKVLVLNCGSSSVKFQLVETDEASSNAGTDRALAKGLVENIGGTALVDNDQILAWLILGAETLQRCDLADDAPPAFLLDSRRQPPQMDALPGRFDNRWMVFPQDFPSANFLRARHISKVLLIQSDAQRQPQEDLAHVLRRWQEAGLELSVATPDTVATPQPLTVNRPSRFRSLWYGALAVMGLRRNSAGGFGSVVPQPSSGG